VRSGPFTDRASLRDDDVGGGAIENDVKLSQADGLCVCSLASSLPPPEAAHLADSAFL
jgi:hypothetical protein